MEKNSKIIAKPSDEEKISSPPAAKTKIKIYRYIRGEEPETSSVTSFARGRMQSEE